MADPLARTQGQMTAGLSQPILWRVNSHFSSNVTSRESRFASASNHCYWLLSTYACQSNDTSHANTNPLSTSLAVTPWGGHQLKGSTFPIDVHLVPMLVDLYTLPHVDPPDTPCAQCNRHEGALSLDSLWTVSGPNLAQTHNGRPHHMEIAAALQGSLSRTA